jgi:hypothetical protein
MSEWIRNACTAALGRPAPAPDRAHIIELLDVLRRTVEEARPQRVGSAATRTALGAADHELVIKPIPLRRAVPDGLRAARRAAHGTWAIA